MRILIIGGVAAGASAAARARRMDDSAEVVVFERGPYVSFANCGLPYYVGGDIEDREDHAEKCAAVVAAAVRVACEMLLDDPEIMKKVNK